MSVLRAARTARAAVRAPARRSYHDFYAKPDPAKGQAFVAEQEAVEHHAASTSKLWLRVSIFLAAPLVTAATIRSYKMEADHIKHLKHAAEHGEEEEEDLPPEFPYQNIRRKDYFWGNGDETLFWNPIANKHRA